VTEPGFNVLNATRRRDQGSVGPYARRQRLAPEYRPRPRYAWGLCVSTGGGTGVCPPVDAPGTWA